MNQANSFTETIMAYLTDNQLLDYLDNKRILWTKILAYASVIYLIMTLVGLIILSCWVTK